ncbi:hypothetical protein [Halovenus halobia]|uniref:hypothetical protein n=1 Tax=Halovenus halobia TaxID=3396622 RepID=UPI003F54CADE
MNNPAPTEATGMLSHTERQFLFGELSTEEDNLPEDLYQQIRKRLEISLIDFKALYCGLRDEDIQAVFDDETGQVTAAPFHDILVLLFYSMLQTDRQPEAHIERALKHAYAAINKHASTQLDVVTEPFLPPERRLEAFAEDGLSRVSMDALEQLYYDELVPPEAFEDVGDGSELLPSAEEIQQVRADVAGLERVPLSVVLDANITAIDASNESEKE